MKKIGISLFILVTISFSVAYFYWKQATKLPEWYSTNETMNQKQTSAGKLDTNTSEEALEFVVQPETEATSTPATGTSATSKT